LEKACLVKTAEYQEAVIEQLLKPMLLQKLPAAIVNKELLDRFKEAYFEKLPSAALQQAPAKR